MWKCEIILQFRMDEMVRGLMQYKNKLDQLKQEKSKLTSSYEVYKSKSITNCHYINVHNFS